MREYPMTFSEFTKRFATEEQCREYLYALRFPEGFICPKCGNQKSWKIGDVLYECSKCGRQTSVIAGTIFQDTRKPLTDWFTAIWWVTTQKNGASAKGLQRVLGLRSYRTAWTWLHKIRNAMIFPNRSKLSGNVEVDESYIGAEEKGGKRGRGTENKTLIAAAVELTDDSKIGRIRMGVIPDASGESLSKFVTANIEIGSDVTTDGWTGYSFLEKNNYRHTVTVQKKANEEDKALPHIHMIFSLLKRWLLGTHQGAVSEKHMQSYLDEYVFRFNRRKAAERGLLFYRLLECAMQVQPITYSELVGRSDDF
jgi:ribosomal protein L37AE/L43A/transposase-like protein